MELRGKAQLEHLVQLLDREHPDWPSSRLEHELEVRAPYDYGNWKDGTPALRSRLRQVQRWRRGDRGTQRRPRSPTLFHHVWPVGDSQRLSVDPEVRGATSGHAGSLRLYLLNCSAETVRELRARVAGREVTFEPALGPGRCTELHWVKHPAIHAAALAAPPHTALRFPLVVEFAVAGGTRSVELRGELTLDESDGWTYFLASDGGGKEIE